MLRSGVMLGLALFGILRVLGHLTDPRLSDREIHRILGEPTRVTAPGNAATVKLVTWNIRHGRAFEGILETLRRLDADILLLQEVDLFCRRSGGRNVAKDLADALEINWLYAGEFQEIGEGRGGIAALTGQAVLSRYPIEDPAVIRFARQARLRWRLNPVQPRRGGRMALRVRAAGILMYNAHIESWGNEKLRRAQLDEILADQARLSGEQTPVVIAGDFNNLPTIRSSLLSRLTATAFVDALADHDGPRRTSIRHDHPLDWIFVRNLAPRGGEVGDGGDSSDHHPVLATLAPGQ